MTDREKNLLWLSLERAIDAWVNNLCDAGAMTDAALAVLTGIAEAQDAAAASGYLKPA